MLWECELDSSDSKKRLNSQVLF